MQPDYTEMLNEAMEWYFIEDDEEHAYTIRMVLEDEWFRSFSDGLTLMLQKTGYSGNIESIDEKSEYLFDKMQKIGSEKISIKTVKSWFQSKHRPYGSGSRKKMYEICFALDLSVPDTYCFFNHVYLERCFNFHNIDEAVYCYCMKHHLSYLKANEIIENIKEIDMKQTEANEVDSDYTHFVKNMIWSFETEDELVNFLATQKGNFETWNLRAYECIMRFYGEIIGEDKTEKVIKKLKNEILSSKNATLLSKEIESFNISTCGLVIREMVWNAQHKIKSDTEYNYLKDEIKRIKGNSISSSFFLKQLCIEPALSLKNFKDLESMTIIAKNFPSEKVFSEVLNNVKIGKSESYDSIRKVLVLLQFYNFWCKEKLKQLDDTGYNTVDLSNVYIDEANYWLNYAGYDDLYPGNPYDWIFLCAAKKEDPLNTLREIINTLMDEGEKYKKKEKKKKE